MHADPASRFADAAMQGIVQHDHGRLERLGHGDFEQGARQAGDQQTVDLDDLVRRQRRRVDVHDSAAPTGPAALLGEVHTVHVDLPRGRAVQDRGRDVAQRADSALRRQRRGDQRSMPLRVIARRRLRRRHVSATP